MSTRIIITVFILMGIFFAISYDKKQIIAPTPKLDNITACTMDTKECADGSFVGRTGPDCQFVCPDIKTQDPITTTGTVKGKVLLSPGCGNPPAEGSCPPVPYKTSILFFTSSSKYTINSDENGYYTAELPFGNYKIQAKGGEVYPECSIENTTIIKGKIITKDIICNSGFL